MLKEALTTSSEFLKIKADLMAVISQTGTGIDKEKIYALASAQYKLCELLHKLALEEQAASEYNKTIMGSGK